MMRRTVGDHIGVVNRKRGQNGDFKRFHLGGVPIVLMVITKQMHHDTMHKQMGEMVINLDSQLIYLRLHRFAGNGNFTKEILAGLVCRSQRIITEQIIIKLGNDSTFVGRSLARN